MHRFMLLAAGTALTLTSHAFAQRMIACDSSRALYEIDIETGAKTSIGTISANAGTTGELAWDDVHGIMYLSSTSLDSLFTLDIATGEATLVGEYGSSDFVMHGLEYDPSTDTLYGVSSHNNGLYNVNKTTGFATLIGTSGLTSFSNLGYDSDHDIMYSTNSGADSFYIMDRNTGATTLVGPLVNSTNPNGVTYDRDNGVLYMVDNSTDNFHSINVNTGVATVIGSTGTGNLLGLAYIPAAPSGPVLRLGGSCPGTVNVAWSNATPQRPLAIIYSTETGSFTLPQGPCGGTVLGLGARGIRLVRTVNTGSGSGQVQGQAGQAVCGGYIQLLVVEAPCSPSNVAQIP